MDLKELERRMIETRRDLHRFPEPAWTEFRTSALVAARLEELGYAPRAGREVIDEGSVMGRPSEAEIDQEIARAVEQGGDRGWIERMGRYTGVTADLDTGRPGPTLAFRFDMDCVDVGEDTSPDHRPAKEGFASVNPCRMHACGHDAHTAIGLGVAELLAEMKGLSLIHI